MAVSAANARLLGGLQAEIESIYRVDAPVRVADYVIDRERWQAFSGSESGAGEELLVVEHHDGLEVGLFLDERVYAELAGPGWTGEKLSAFCQALEGVSHFVYLTHRAAQPRPVSQLELELQAEIDKFATVLLHLWEAGQKHAAQALRRRLFEEVSYREDLSGEARERYRQANVLARAYCRFLEAKYVVQNRVEGFLADLRRMYRLGAAEKLSYAACGAAL